MRIDDNDPRPPYRQAADDLAERIGKGEFAPGEKLKSIRDLAEEYGVAPQTMQNALRELRDAGLLVSQQGRGLFVRDPARPATAPTRADARRLAAIEAELRELRERVEAIEAENADLRALVTGPGGHEGRTAGR